MTITEFYLALLVGLLLSLAVEEFFGIASGGVIVAGYLSMICDDLISVGIVLLIALLTYLIVEFVLPRFMLLFGKRKFVACILVAMVFKLLTDFLIPIMPVETLAFRGIGVITPGLIAFTTTKQGIHITFPAVLVVSYLTFGVVQGLLHIL